MLKENIKAIRKAKGFSQEDLSVQLNVVRQTISKWENGLSVPDSEMLISISEVLETPVSVLLGENIPEKKEEDIKVISEKLEQINLQLAKKHTLKRKKIYWLLCLVLVMVVIIATALIVFNSSYLNWDYHNPEKAVLGVNLHILEWCFVRVAPLIVIGGIVGIIFMRKRR